MLERLEVRNYVLIPYLVMDFSNGFTVITGETGSGKSIILGALGLILGEKSRADMVRQGEKEAHVEALFSYREGEEVAHFLEERDLVDEEGGLFIQRIVRSSGRSIMTVNGKAVTRETLEELGRLLVDVSGQSSHQSLLHRSVQLSLLDRYAHDEDLVSSYRSAYEEYVACQKEHDRILEESEKAGREADYMRFCLDEIEKAGVRVGEDDELATQLRKMEQGELLSGELDEAVSSLRGGHETGALNLIARAQSSIARAMKADPGLEDFHSRLESASIEIEDIASSLSDYLSTLSFSEEELDAANARLSILQRLKKKYGGSLEAVLQKRDSFASALATVENLDDLLLENRKRMEKAEKEADRLARKLSEERRKAATSLEKTVLENLAHLGLKSAMFRIDLSQKPMGHNGIDECVFMLSANKGEKEGLISQVASGGELSRIMLALKAALSGQDEVETLLFDEIDSGIGGAVANAVADELKTLSISHQVIAITHLAQLASRAADHYMVTKSEEGGRTVSSIVPISGQERIDELARLLSGSVNEISREHARSLLEEEVRH